MKTKASGLGIELDQKILETMIKPKKNIIITKSKKADFYDLKQIFP
jgi:hypothetical protein